MNIYYDPTQKVFHLINGQISYVIGILRNGHLGHFYFGKALHPNEAMNQSLFRQDQNRGLTNYVYEGDMGFSLNLEKLEMPCFGTTDYRSPSIDILMESGSGIIDFIYTDHTIFAGKKNLEGLPSTRYECDQDVMTLEIKMTDPVMGSVLYLSYSIFREYPVIARSSRLMHQDPSPIRLKRLMSLSLDLDDSDWEWLQLYGDWTRERHIACQPLHHGIQSIGSMRGASSAAYNPFVAMKRNSTTEDSGEAIGVSLVYSGNFLMQIEVDGDDSARLMAGIHPHGFEWVLNEGDIFQSPEALLAFAPNGLGGVSRTFHDLFREHLIAVRWRDKPRQVLLNNWEATYFDFDERKILDLAKGAKALGIELLVLDDGWFGTRNDDTSSLGDWSVNLNKVPSGIKKLSHEIVAFGIEFGLWIEPEMINKRSRLFELHPDWLIGDPERNMSHGRNQYVLDFSRPEVVEGIYQQLIQVFDGSAITYIKWDMNRNITEAYSRGLAPEKQGELMHRYILGVYTLYERMTARYPNILFESCSAGGGRFDPGMLYYAPQAWTSDNTDAVERLKIQYGTSLIYPLVTMGSHVSDVPNHQVLRQTPLKMRADVAYFGTFGYELNILKLSYEQKMEVVEQIEFFKSSRDLIHKGDFYRLINPFSGSGNQTAWMVVSKDGSNALVAWYQILARPNDQTTRLRLHGLDEECFYEVSGYDHPLSGRYLMYLGLLIRPSFNGIEHSGDPEGDYQSRIWTIKK
jgi:alpha-galactosidase